MVKMHPRFLALQNGIEQLTPEWFKERRGRLTGSKLSNFCFIKTEDEYDDYYGIIFEGKPRPPFSEQAQKYMEYGRKHEDVAICSFLNDAPKRVGDIYIAESPFFKHTDPTLGASPDGTYAIYSEGNIVEEGVIEIKCPGKAPNRPYPKWKYYYVPQTFWEMACSGHRKAITVSWGPRNMRAWRYEWDDSYWKCLCNIVDAFRRHVPYIEFQALQAELIEASHRIANNAECLHPAKGWKQFAHNTDKIMKAIESMQQISVTSEALSLDSFMKRDILFAEVKFHPGTEWFKEVLSKNVAKEDMEREFVVMKSSPVIVVPGFSSGGEIKIDPDEKIILSLKYYE